MKSIFESIFLQTAVVSGLLVLSISGCALPIPEEQQQDYVTEREIQVVSLTRQGLSYAKRSRLVDAELKLRQAHFLAPDQFNIALNLAVVLDRQGLFIESAGLYRQLLKKKPRSIKLLSGLAHVSMSQYEFGEAERVYSKALAIALDENLTAEVVQLSRSLAVLNFLRGDEEAALCWSSFAVRQSGKDVSQFFRHSRLLLASGQTSSVIESVKASSMNPISHPNLGIVLAQALIATGDKQKALDLIQALNASSNLPPALSFELSLLKALLFEESDKISDEQREEYEAKKDELFSILDTDPLESQLSIYWPVEIVDSLSELHLERTEVLEEREKSLLWFKPQS